MKWGREGNDQITTMSLLPLPVVFLTICVCITHAQYNPHALHNPRALYNPQPRYKNLAPYNPLRTDTSDNSEPKRSPKINPRGVITWCRAVTAIPGVEYSDNSTDVDFDGLTVNLFNSYFEESLNLTSAAESIVLNSPWFRQFTDKKIYIHGFSDDPDSESYEFVKKAFLSNGDADFMTLDLSSLRRWFYLRSLNIVEYVGEQLAKLIATFIEGGIPHSSIHIIGHSLGAHIAGHTGKTLIQLTGAKVARITGLDPSGECFAPIRNVSKRLFRLDAEFVDVIRTDSQYGDNWSFGIIAGDALFLPNYPISGNQQPGCRESPAVTCSHIRAWLLFAESIKNPKAFPAVKCPTKADLLENKCTEISYMGYACPPTARGTYYLKTAAQSPFSLGENGTNLSR